MQDKPPFLRSPRDMEPRNWPMIDKLSVLLKCSVRDPSLEQTLQLVQFQCLSYVVCFRSGVIPSGPTDLTRSLSSALSNAKGTLSRVDCCKDGIGILMQKTIGTCMTPNILH
jgi:hypothetical protein